MHGRKQSVLLVLFIRFDIHVLFVLKEMKAMLYAAVEEAPSAESVEPEVISRHFASFDEVFFTFCDRELKKINTFYSGEEYSAPCCVGQLFMVFDNAV